MKSLLAFIRNLPNEFIKVWMPPIFPEDVERTRLTRVLNAVLLLVIVANAIYLLVIVTIGVQKFYSLIISSSLILITIATYGLMRIGKIQLASLILVFGWWAISVVGVLFSGGPRIGGAALFLVATILAGLLLGEKASVRMTILSMLASLAMVIWELSGYALPIVFPFPSLVSWVILMICMLFVTIIINQSNNSFRQALALAHNQMAERKKVEVVLRENEQRYAVIAENIPGLIFQVRFGPDGAYKFTYASPRGLEMMEMPPDLVETGWKIGNLVYWEDQPAYFQIMQEAIANHAGWHAEFRRVMSTGHLRWTLGVASPIMDGDTLVYNGILLDIDEVKQAKAETERLNQELHQRVEDRSRELAALSQVMRLSIQSGSSDQLAENILNVVFKPAEFKAGMVHMEQDEGGPLILKAQHALPAELVNSCQVLNQTDNLIGKVAHSGEMLIVNDLAELDPATRGSLADYFQTFVGVPIRVKGRPCGVLSVFGAIGQPINADFGFFLSNVADMLSVAVENIDLRRQAEHAAKLEERQRLARDLHDSVSQTLFSASALAETLPLVWEQDPTRGKTYMTSLLRLTRAALAEMRTLLVELRPQALLRTNLADLIRQLADGFAGHSLAEVALNITGKGVLAPDVQTMFYRVAQEALNNIAKHAQANQVSVHFILEAGHASLVVEDDGQGFDEEHPSEGFGIKIMQERAVSVGADFDLISQPGHGTTVILKWQNHEKGSKG